MKGMALLFVEINKTIDLRDTVRKLCDNLDATNTSNKSPLLKYF